MHVLVAPDKFKGSLTAVEVAERVAAGLRAAAPTAEVRTLPVADGGDGTVDAAVAAGFARTPVRANGPTGAPVDTSYARRDHLAVIELAHVCGLLLLPDGVADPLHASSFGVGQVMAAALDAGCTDIVLGIGGSASTDGGAGMLQALGARLAGPDGMDLPPKGLPLTGDYRLDLSGLHPALRHARITVACDVDNPLYGPRGAAAVYGPQKGASPAQVAELDAALRLWSSKVADVTGADHADVAGAGAAGGVGFAAIACLGGALRPGIELILELLRFAAHLPWCDLVITGEGALDEQTLAGKAPAGVAAAATRSGVPTIAVAGRVLLDGEALRAAGIVAAYALADIEPDPARSIANAGPLLQRLAETIGRDHLLGRGTAGAGRP